MIQTERLLLRPLVQADMSALHRIFSDTQAMRYWSKPPFENTEQTQEFVTAVLRADPATTIEFVIEYGGTVIGRAGFWRLPEIGYILHPDFWGQGFGTEAVAALISHGFEAHGLMEATADVDPDNTASLRLLENLGFVETGREKNTLQIGDAWFDSVYLRLGAEAWQAQK